MLNFVSFPTLGAMTWTERSPYGVDNGNSFLHKVHLLELASCKQRLKLLLNYWNNAAQQRRVRIPEVEENFQYNNLGR